MVNCNPETVSTDPDTSDRLYFEPLTAEDVLEIVRREQEKGELLGVIVQLGGQTPLKLAAELQAAGVPILGTSPDSIDLAEDRERFAALVEQAGPQAAGQRHRAQPRRGAAGGGADRLSGAAAAVLRARRARAWRSSTGRSSSTIISRPRSQVSGNEPGADRPLSARRDRGRRRCHLRRHRRRGRRRPPAYRGSGRAFGRQRLLDPAAQPVAARSSREIERQTRELALALKVKGLMNVQFAVKDDEVYLIEVNPRASRTVPFVAKAIGRADRQDRGAGDGRRAAGRASARSTATSTISRSRNRCSRSRASRGPIRCLDRK